MNLLVVAPRVPWPPHQGTALRNLNILRHLARRHRVTLLAFEPAGAERGPIADWGVRLVTAPPPPPRPFLRRLVDLPTTRVPDLVRRLDSPDMDRAVQTLVRETAESGAPFDLIQVEGLEMARYGLDLLDALGRSRSQGQGQAEPPRLVYDAHNAEWVLQDRAWRTDLRRPRGWPGALYSLFQTAKIRRFEAGLMRRAAATVAVSRADEAALRSLVPEARMAVVPNGVDVDAYPVADPAQTEPGLLVYTGKMDFRPNVDAMTWFAEAVLPRLRARQPRARLAIVGRDPHPRVQALHAPERGIEVTGAVPEIQPWIARAEVVVVPLRVGGGTRLKVLEAMAMGKALVATSLGVEGLGLTPGVELEIADEPEGMARALAGLLGDEQRRAALGRAARARAVADYRWEVLVPHIEAMYAEPEDGSGSLAPVGSATDRRSALDASATPNPSATNAAKDGASS